MSLFLDTSFLIAIHTAKDEHHSDAIAIKERIKNGEFGQCYFSEYIFDEFVTFLRAKSASTTSITQLGDALLREEIVRMVSIDTQLFSRAWDFFKKINALSFTDCTSVVIAKELNIKYIASFDSDFDRIIGLKRVC